jgi:hypothetical protein
MSKPELQNTLLCPSCKKRPCECVTNAELAPESYDEKFDRMKKRKEERECKTTTEAQYRG